MMRDSLGHTTRIHENERGAMFLDQLRQSRINFLPDFVRHHGFERRLRNLNPEIELAFVSHVDDGAIWIASSIDITRSNEKTRDFFNRFLSGRKPDPLQ